MSLNVKIKILNERLRALGHTPKFATSGSAAIDLRACSMDASTCSAAEYREFHEYSGTCLIKPGEFKVFRLGIAVEIPPGYAGLILPRSGQGMNLGLRLCNTTGVIDSDYRGELMAGIECPPNRVGFVVEQYERVAQMLFVPLLTQISILGPDEELSVTDRGANGFGSTGTS